MPELQFKGKEFVYNHHLTVPFRPLVPVAAKSIGEPRLDGNLVVHGDNLHALKALLPMLAGKVDCVFIDPPYNTGNESWSYNDNVNSPLMQEWLKSNPVNREDMLRHDKWLCLMYPRLRLLWELVSLRGSLWMTLDDNEMHRARAILDEIFGEDNFLGVVAWEKADSPRMDADLFSTRHDYVIAYARSKKDVLFHRLGADDPEPPEHYTMEDDEGRKYYLKPLRAMGGQGETREARPNLYFEMTAPDGTAVFPKLQDGGDGAWRWSTKKVQRESWRIEWRKGENGWTPYFRIYDNGLGRPPETIFPHDEVGSSRTAKAQIKAIFGGTAEFETPKPLGLLERVLEIATNPESIVLDSFAGSGTTAHAVLLANKKDDGSRRFVLVEAEDYADTLTAERVRRAIKGYSYKGTQREELFREKLAFRTLKDTSKLLDRITGIENLESPNFSSIEKTIDGDFVVVVGEREVEEAVDGVGGEFTFATLGEQIDLDRLLTGANLPDFASLGAWLFHTATGRAFDPAKADAESGFLGETENSFVWLIYKPDLAFLMSREAVLTLSVAERLTKQKTGKGHLVFAPTKFVPNRTLAAMDVDFAQLPFAVYRLEKA